MRTLQRTRVHRQDRMPGNVVVWVEPADDGSADIYLNADLVTDEEAEAVQETLDAQAR